MKFSREERETTMTFEEATGELTVYTSVASHIKLFSSIDTKDLEVLTESKGKPTSIRVTLPGSTVSIGGLIKKKRVVSDRQRESLAKAREAKKALK
ncbi:hypothetical protein ASG65_26165 [Bacillus sp. Leaf13]|nr:hypothetical protein ASG65_26165 [Bacillus sp. Leaf13]